MNKRENKKLRIFPTEIFKEVEFDCKFKLRYAISNFGRFISFSDKMEEGRIVKGGMIEGFRIFRYKISQGNKILNKHKFFYKLVAENFLEKSSEEQVCVVHLDHNLANDFVGNLKWVTKEERYAHYKANPKVIEAKKKSTARLVAYNKNRDGTKLTTTKVMLIKKILANPNRKTRLKIIAKRFGISEMQLYRIKTGENWGHVKI